MTRFALMILVGTICFVVSTARADEAFVKVNVDGHVGYIISMKRAVTLRKPPFEFAKYATGFWTPTAAQVVAAEKASHKWVETATNSPEKTFPGIAAHPGVFGIPTLAKLELLARDIIKSYDHYTRQFIGLEMYDGKKSSRAIYCNYFSPIPAEDFASKEMAENYKTEMDPAKRYIEVDDGGADFWQTIYDLDSKKCASLSINSSP